MLNFNLPLRMLQLLLALVTLGLNGYVTSWYLRHTHPAATPNEAPFFLFVGAWTLLFLPYLLFNPALSHTTGNKPNGRYFNKWHFLVLDAVTCLLWFAGFVGLAEFRSHLILCGRYVCTVMAAAIALGALAWVSFLATTLLATLHIVRTPAGPSDQNHTAWVGKQPTVQI